MSEKKSIEYGLKMAPHRGRGKDMLSRLTTYESRPVPFRYSVRKDEMDSRKYSPAPCGGFNASRKQYMLPSQSVILFTGRKAGITAVHNPIAVEPRLGVLTPPKSLFFPLALPKNRSSLRRAILPPKLIQRLAAALANDCKMMLTRKSLTCSLGHKFRRANPRRTIIGGISWFRSSWPQPPPWLT